MRAEIGQLLLEELLFCGDQMRNVLRDALRGNSQLADKWDALVGRVAAEMENGGRVTPKEGRGT